MVSLEKHYMKVESHFGRRRDSILASVRQLRVETGCYNVEKSSLGRQEVFRESVVSDSLS